MPCLFQLLEFVRDGLPLEQVLANGRRMIGKRHVQPGVDKMVREVVVEATFADGLRIVRSSLTLTSIIIGKMSIYIQVFSVFRLCCFLPSQIRVDDPVCTNEGDVELALHGSFLQPVSKTTASASDASKSVVKVEAADAVKPAVMASVASWPGQIIPLTSRVGGEQLDDDEHDDDVVEEEQIVAGDEDGGEEGEIGEVDVQPARKRKRETSSIHTRPSTTNNNNVKQTSDFIALNEDKGEPIPLHVTNTAAVSIQVSRRFASFVQYSTYL